MLSKTLILGYYLQERHYHYCMTMQLFINVYDGVPLFEVIYIGTIKSPFIYAIPIHPLKRGDTKP